jgi:Flp pilus assembly protein TadD
MTPGGTNGSRWRRRFFLLFTCAAPLIFLVLLEIGLRLVGFGQSYPLFLTNEYRPDYMVTNPQVARRYFPGSSKAPVSLDINFFPATKRPETFRIFVQGGSTAAGFPFGQGASLAGMLRHRLQQTFPNREIEMVSTALSAVNSYTLLDFSEEILEQNPDAVLIYAGHNEYLGVLGAGSVFAGGLARPMVLALLKLRDLRILQLLQRAYATGRGWLVAGQRPVKAPTLMASIAGAGPIPFDSARYRQGLEQFRRNLDRLLARYRDLGIPVFIGTLVSNERDQEPFFSAPAAKTDAGEWQHLYETGMEALGRGELSTAATSLQAALAMDDTAADAHFAFGRLLDGAAEYADARAAYGRARDRDQLPFRAPGIFNTVIRDAAARHQAHLVEVEASFRGASPGGILGRDLFLEHLHPNLRGYFLLANSFYEAMQEVQLIGSWEHPVTAEQAWQQLPLTVVDHLAGLLTVARMKANWPFRETGGEPEIPQPANLVEKLALQRFRKEVPWVSAMQQLFQHYQQTGSSAQATRVAWIVADALPYNERPQYTAGVMLMREGRNPEALRYLHRAARLAPAEPRVLLALARAEIAVGDRVGARETLAALLRIKPGDPTAVELLRSMDP